MVKEKLFKVVMKRDLSPILLYCYFCNRLIIHCYITTRSQIL